MNLTHSQVDAEIEVAPENEKMQDSKKAETEVSKWPSAERGATNVFNFFLGALSSSNI